jgi:hypothetical protein
METPMLLNKAIYDRANELGIKKITLHFSGGNDEGFLNVDLVPHPKDDDDFASDVEDWAWGRMVTCGAGDGSDYGDDIVYDLEKCTVTASDWYMARTKCDEEEVKLQVEDES